MKRQDSIFNNINKQWNFNAPQMPDEVRISLRDWKEWQDFEHEITSKPLKTLTAFRTESTKLVELSGKLLNNIPENYRKPEVESRINLMITQINTLDMFMELDVIPEKETALLIPNINKSFQSIADQFSEIHIRRKIPKEHGEDQLIPKIDTVRRATQQAIPKE